MRSSTPGSVLECSSWRVSGAAGGALLHRKDRSFCDSARFSMVRQTLGCDRPKVKRFHPVLTPFLPSRFSRSEGSCLLSFGRSQNLVLFLYEIFQMRPERDQPQIRSHITRETSTSPSRYPGEWMDLSAFGDVFEDSDRPLEACIGLLPILAMGIAGDSW